MFFILVHPNRSRENGQGWTQASTMSLQKGKQHRRVRSPVALLLCLSFFLRSFAPGACAFHKPFVRCALSRHNGDKQRRCRWSSAAETRTLIPVIGTGTSLFAESNPRKQKSSLNVDLNKFFKDPVPQSIAQTVEVSSQAAQRVIDGDGSSVSVVDYITAPPGSPGVPRPLWLVVLASIPTGLLWYGYYKFAVEEELLQIELDQGKGPRGFGGYGTLGPFTYLMAFGALGQVLHIPGASLLTVMGIVFIYYTQFLLYGRVNELYREEKDLVGGPGPEPLQVWWCLPFFFPFNVIVGVRQVHFLSQYNYRQAGMNPPPSDPIVDFFPFIGAKPYTWQEFLTTPSMWCSLLKDVEDIPGDRLPGPIKAVMEWGSPRDQKE
jgi:hypothetical protein